MIYFFLNVVMYLFMFLLVIYYFKNKINLTSFLLIIFNMNISLIFIILNYNFLYGMLFSLLSIIFYKFVILFEKNSKEIILIKDGNINFHELIKNYSFQRLLLDLKIRHIRLDEIAYFIKNKYGITIIKNQEIKSYPVSIIVDGNLLMENLKLVNKSREWLKDELLKNNLLIKNVNYAYYKTGKIYFVV